jgi:hypothetical protein
MNDSLVQVISDFKEWIVSNENIDYSGKSEPVFWRKVSHPDLLL